MSNVFYKLLLFGIFVFWWGLIRFLFLELYFLRHEFHKACIVENIPNFTIFILSTQWPKTQNGFLEKTKGQN